MINQSILSIERSISTQASSVSITGAASGVPAGGTTGQILAKQSNNNYDTHWINQQASNSEFLLQTVYNGPGSTISKGEVVYIVGAQGISVTVDRAIASLAHDSEVIGVALDNILSNQTGRIVIHGVINGLNTNSFSEGDRLYLSPTSYGQITNVEPFAPNHAILIGYCVKKGIADGSIYVNVNDGQHLKELHDVNVDSAVSGQYLFLDSDQIWKNKTIEYTDVSGLTGILSGLYPRSNPSGYISGDLSLLYPRSNPSGYISGIENLVYTTGDQSISGNKIFENLLQVSGLEVGLGNQLPTFHIEEGRVGVNNENPTSALDVSGLAKFSERPFVNGTGMVLSGEIDTSSLYPRSNPSGFITGVDTSNFYTNDNPSGFITGISNLVYTTGDQGISGRKLFLDGLDAGLQAGVSTLYIGSGLVGVNNEDPQAAFHVSGSALFANDVTILGNFSVSGTTYINEVIDVTTTGTISGVTGVFQHIEADNIVYSQTNACVVAQPGDDLVAKYAEAAALTAPNGSPRSNLNRASLVIFPGTYTLSETLNISASFVDVIGLGSTDKSPLVLIPTSESNVYGINVSASDVKVVGIGVLGVDGDGFKVSGGSASQIFENCTTGKNGNDFGGSGVYTNCYAFETAFNGNGTYNNCSAGDTSFNGGGVYIDCSSGTESFQGNGSSYTNCSAGTESFSGAGTYKDCSAGGTSFNGNGASYIRCIGSTNCFGATLVEGTYTDCSAGDFSFGASTNPVTITGTFENCTAGIGSFGNSPDVVTITGATFKNCHGGLGCFGNSDANVDIIGSSTFEDCTAGNSSFGSSNAATASIVGVFLSCSAGNNSFGCGYTASIQNSIFKNCIAVNNNFGWGEGVSITNSTFDNCRAVDESFVKCFSGGGGVDSSSLFNNCIAGNRSFGNSPAALTVAGTFKNCKGGSNCFGVDMEFVAITGKIINCEANSFPSVVYDSGLIFNCIDGNGDIINAEA